jgi:hypothetical protein
MRKSPEPIEAAPSSLIFGKRSLQGWPSGIPTDSEDTLRFAEMTCVRGKAEFRVVLTM